MDIKYKFFPILFLLVMNTVTAEVLVANYNSTDVLPLNIEEGYLILDLDLESPVSEIILKRKIEKFSYHGYKKSTVRVTNLKQGNNLALIKLSAGTYRWEEIKVPFYNLPYRFELSRKNFWQFKIYPNRLNYVSKIIVKENRSSTSAHIKRLNRIAESLPKINQQLKGKLLLYPLIYSALKPDDFLGLIENE